MVEALILSLWRCEVGTHQEEGIIGIAREAFQADDKAKTLHQVLHNLPKPPRRINPKIPTDLETLCSKAMEKDPAQRYQSAQLMAEDLRRKSKKNFD